MNRISTGVFLGLLASALSVAIPAAAQQRAEVTAVWRAGEPASGTEPGEVCLLRDADLSEVGAVTVGDTLAAGDQVKAGPCDGDPADLSSEALKEFLLGLRCGDGTDIQLSGPFDLLILEPDSVDCAVDLTSGTSDVLTDQPATVTSGGITLGVEGTQFSVTREPAPLEASGESTLVCKLFEGRLRVRNSDAQYEISGGEVWALERGSMLRKSLETNDVVAAAQRAARFDVARAYVAGPLASPPSEAVATLTRSHLTTMMKPADTDARQTLVESLSRLGLEQRATFERQRIETIRLDAQRLDSQRLDSKNLERKNLDSKNLDRQRLKVHSKDGEGDGGPCVP